MTTSPTLECTKHLTQVEYWIGGNSYRIQQENNSLDHGTTLWDSSKVLALYFYNLQQKKTNLTKLDHVLELGAGTGLAGIVAASLGYSTIITDQEHLINLLNYNIKLNAHLIPKLNNEELIISLQQRNELLNINNNNNNNNNNINNPIIKADKLFWGDEFDLQKYTQISKLYPFSYILAADCIYDLNVLELFLKTLLKIVLSSKTIILVALEPRDPIVIETFVDRSKELGFTISKILKQKLPKPYNLPEAPCIIYKLKKKV